MPVPERPSRGPRRLLRDLTFESVLGAIVDGTLRPGERIFEDDVAAWLGVSKTPVKEALARLAAQGLVEIEANRWTRVAPACAEDLLDALELLGLLHGVALRSAPADDPALDRLADDVLAVLDGPDSTCADLVAATAGALPLSASPLARQAAEPLQHRASFLSRHLRVPLSLPPLRPGVARLRSTLAERDWPGVGAEVTGLLARRTLLPLVPGTPRTELDADGASERRSSRGRELVLAERASEASRR